MVVHTENGTFGCGNSSRFKWHSMNERMLSRVAVPLRPASALGVLMTSAPPIRGRRQANFTSSEMTRRRS